MTSSSKHLCYQIFKLSFQIPALQRYHHLSEKLLLGLKQCVALVEEPKHQPTVWYINNISQSFSLFVHQKPFLACFWLKRLKLNMLSFKVKHTVHNSLRCVELILKNCWANSVILLFLSGFHKEISDHGMFEVTVCFPLLNIDPLAKCSHIW